MVQVLQFFMQSQTYGTTGKRHCDLEVAEAQEGNAGHNYPLRSHDYLTNRWQVHNEGIGGTLHFVQFETSSMERHISVCVVIPCHEHVRMMP